MIVSCEKEFVSAFNWTNSTPRQVTIIYIFSKTQSLLCGHTVRNFDCVDHSIYNSINAFQGWAGSGGMIKSALQMDINSEGMTAKWV